LQSTDDVGNKHEAVRDKENSDEPNEISYTVLSVRGDLNEKLQALATAINLRLNFEDKENFFPFIPCEKSDSLINEDILFVYGPSGCGKSRHIFEALRDSIFQYKNIYILNPRSANIAETGRGKLVDIIRRIQEQDALIWDNFPDDLIKKDAINSLRVLELIGSSRSKKVIITLKPRYLELFKDLTSGIAEFCSVGISYGKDQIKHMIKSYGANIPEFRQVYEKYVANDLDKIARILWQKDPIPITILDYYNDLINKEYANNGMTTSGVIDVNLKRKSIDGVLIAEKLLRSASYYEHQFTLLNSIKGRENEIEFLFTLRLFYELGLERNLKSVEQFQKEIFGSNCYRPNRNLGTWIYLSGQHYSMHDVCREAINLDSELKMIILDYISSNFEKVISNEPNRINSVALFLGRNVQFLPRDVSHPFVPDDVYQFMKKNIQFERTFGLGVGEVFESLDEELQKTIFSKVDSEIEFAVGIAESLGYRFSTLDEEDRNKILKKMSDVFLFARHFGQSLGRLYKYLSDDIKKEISEYRGRSPQFSDGIGMGIGYIYETLDNDTQKFIFSEANSNPEMMRGLGFGFGLRFPTSNGTTQQETISIADTHSEFDFGFGFASGTVYKDLSEELKNKVLLRIQNYSLFSLGVGLYVAFSDPNNCPTDLVAMTDQNGEMAFGLGVGFGINMSYLSEELRTTLDSKAKENIRLDIGIGEGLGHIFKHLPEQMQKTFLQHGNSNAAFDEGLGIGIGTEWNYNDVKTRNLAIERSKRNSAFAIGFGFGIGFRYGYYDEEMKRAILDLADQNSKLDWGLGFGIGMEFPYLGNFKSEIIDRTLKNSAFAYGFGSGIGIIYKYLNSVRKVEIKSIASSNSIFARGLGHGVGLYTLIHCDDSFQKELFLQAESDGEFAIGLGEGIGYGFRYFNQESKERFLNDTINQNMRFARGLGIGMGKSFQNMTKEVRNDVFLRARENIHFATGLGEGIGGIFSYIDDSLRNEMYSEEAGETAFARGLGIGMGSVFNYLPDISKTDILRELGQNNQFARGLGIGMGSVFNYLPDTYKKDALARAEENIHFATGLGEGIGGIFSYIENTFLKTLILKAENNPSFVRGLGIGIGAYYKYHTEDYLHHIGRLPFSNNNQFIMGFGIGTANAFIYLTRDSQNKLLEKAEQNSKLAESLGLGLGHFISYIPKYQREKIFGKKLLTNFAFAYGYGIGIGHSFPSLNAEMQRESFRMSKEYDVFAYGLGIGIGKVFDKLDNILQMKMLEYGSLDSAFAYGLGIGIGHSFPSLVEQSQLEIIKLSESNSIFTTGLMGVLKNSLVYLSADLKQRIMDRAKRSSQSLAEYIKDNKKAVDLLEIAKSVEKGDDSHDSILQGFPIVGLVSDRQKDMNDVSSLPIANEEIVFLGKRHRCCVCFIDIVGSTTIASQLKEDQVNNYYTIFLNAMATIAKNFGANIIKNAGDALIFYFPDTIESDSTEHFRNVLECGITMIAAHKAINARLHEKKLPPVSYRISSDYGIVEVARSQSSQSVDLFGSTMNLCAKMNSKAEPNGMVIGQELYARVKSFIDCYSFRKEEIYVRSDTEKVTSVIYHVENKAGDILNPFKHRVDNRWSKDSKA